MPRNVRIDQKLESPVLDLQLRFLAWALLFSSLGYCVHTGLVIVAIYLNYRSHLWGDANKMLSASSILGEQLVLNRDDPGGNVRELLSHPKRRSQGPEHKERGWEDQA